MKFVSTRSADSGVSFYQMALCGLCPDGGLYMPDAVPIVSPAELVAWSNLSYIELAKRIFAKFVPGLPDSRFEKSYRGTFPEEPAPLTYLKDDIWLLELYHGPTLSFKDFALQFLGNLIEHIITFVKDESNFLVLGGTSGDTGSAAIAGFQGKSGIPVAILYPKDRVSPLQELQMITADGSNLRCIAIDGGSFDDCQAMVKRAFSDSCIPFKLIAVNSINFTRIIAQIVYYFYSFFKLKSNTKISFVVPTGNFGNVFAAYYARQMGLPIHRIVIGTNPNDILVRFWHTGTYEAQPVKATCAPSMDIQVSSNFERYLYMASLGDWRIVADLMADLSKTGSFTAPTQIWQQMRQDFFAISVDEVTIKDSITLIFQETGKIIDPHTAVGAAAAIKQSKRQVTDEIMVCLATADPSKFPETVHQCTGRICQNPVLEAIQKKPVKCKYILPNTYEALLNFLRATFNEEE